MDWSRRIEEWEKTSYIIATLTNVNRGKDQQPVDLDRFNFYKRADQLARRPQTPVDPRMRFL
jgi:hypothetical protein